MPSTTHKSFLRFTVAIALLLWTGFLRAEVSRDILLGIAEKCLDTKAPNYCSACSIPSTDSACTNQGQCRLSLDLWSLSEEFASFRDAKMCGCNKEFIHGLTIPRQTVTGVEDPRRPDTIWDFAWRVGLERVPEQELALVVNPKNKRSQDQLHVHMLRYFPERQSEMNQYRVAEINDLKSVWRVAKEYADQKNWNDYGVLVMKNDRNSYSVFVTPFNSEHAFTQYRCN